MTQDARAELLALVHAWSARWHALCDAAGLLADPEARVRMLAIAEGIETCDMDARRAVAELLRSSGLQR